MSEPAQPLEARPLTRESFAEYGEVIDATGREPVAVNEGTSWKYPDLATVEIAGESDAARVGAISLFCARPRPQPMELTLLERHPRGSQAFMPLSTTRYAVVVAGQGDAPGSTDVRLFLARGQQGVSFRPGVWHHPLLALDRPCDFLVVDRRDPSDNLDTIDIRGWRILVAC